MRRRILVPQSGMSDAAALQRGLVAASGFSPSQLSNLKFWLTTGDIRNPGAYADTGLTTPCTDGIEALGWKDQSANALNFVHASTGPFLETAQTSESDSPNGKSRLRFNGSDSQLQAAAAASWKEPHNGTGFEMFFVCKPAASTNNQLFDSTNLLAGEGVWISVDNASGAVGKFQVAIRSSVGNIAYNPPGTTSNVWPPDEWHVGSYYYSSAAGLAQYLDGCFITSAAAGSPTNNNPARAPILGTSAVPGFSTTKYGDMFGYTTVLSASDRRKCFNYLGQRFGIPIGNVACIGDSITGGYAANATSYPTALQQRLGAQWKVTNFGVSGARIDTSSPDVYDEQWLALVQRKRYNIIVCLAGINDIRNSVSGSTAFGQLQTLYSSILADPGNKLVVCTLLPFHDSTWGAGTTQVELLDLNNRLRNYGSSTPNVTCLDLWPAFTDPSDPNYINPLFELDKLHPNQSGSNLIAAMAADHLLTKVGLDL